MALDDVPLAEPMSPGAERFSREALKRGAAHNGILLSYGDDPMQSMLVFPAKRPTGPVLIFYHGGNWTNGSKDWFAYLAPLLTARGITFVSVGYRLAPGAMFPVGWEDALYGFDIAVRNIAKFGGDPNRVFVSGHDAGAHYAALMALKAGWRDALSLPMDVVKGCLPISGFYDFGPNAGFKSRPMFLGMPEQKGERYASAIRYGHPKAPPFLVTYGSDDLPHARSQGHDFVRALRREHMMAEELVLEGQDHFGTALAIAEENGPWIAAVNWMTGNTG